MLCNLSNCWVLQGIVASVCGDSWIHGYRFLCTIHERVTQRLLIIHLSDHIHIHQTAASFLCNVPCDLDSALFAPNSQARRPCKFLDTFASQAKLTNRCTHIFRTTESRPRVFWEWVPLRATLASTVYPQSGHKFMTGFHRQTLSHNLRPETITLVWNGWKAECVKSETGSRRSPPMHMFLWKRTHGLRQLTRTALPPADCSSPGFLFSLTSVSFPAKTTHCDLQRNLPPRIFHLLSPPRISWEQLLSARSISPGLLTSCWISTDSPKSRASFRLMVSSLECLTRRAFAIAFTRLTQFNLFAHSSGLSSDSRVTSSGFTAYDAL